MQQAGLEWVYRLQQEPKRLYQRYRKDLKEFGQAFARQHWLMKKPAATAAEPVGTTALLVEPTWRRIMPPAAFDRDSILRDEKIWRESRCNHCLLDVAHIEHIDGTAVGLLLHLHKTLCKRGLYLILLNPSEHLQRVFTLMRLERYFITAADVHEAREIILRRQEEARLCYQPVNFHPTFPLVWRGEITAANAEAVWEQIEAELTAMSGTSQCVPIDLSELRFIDSTGVGLLARARKQSEQLGMELRFTEISPAVRNVLRMSRMESLLEEKK